MKCHTGGRPGPPPSSSPLIYPRTAIHTSFISCDVVRPFVQVYRLPATVLGGHIAWPLEMAGAVGAAFQRHMATADRRLGLMFLIMPKQVLVNGVFAGPPAAGWAELLPFLKIEGGQNGFIEGTYAECYHRFAGALLRRRWREEGMGLGQARTVPQEQDISLLVFSTEDGLRGIGGRIRLMDGSLHSTDGGWRLTDSKIGSTWHRVRGALGVCACVRACPPSAGVIQCRPQPGGYH